MELIIPKRYKLKLLPETTEIAIKFIKDSFQERLAKRLNLRRVTAPLLCSLAPVLTTTSTAWSTPSVSTSKPWATAMPKLSTHWQNGSAQNSEPTALRPASDSTPT